MAAPSPLRAFVSDQAGAASPRPSLPNPGQGPRAGVQVVRSFCRLPVGSGQQRISRPPEGERTWARLGLLQPQLHLGPIGAKAGEVTWTIGRARLFAQGAMG